MKRCGAQGESLVSDLKGSAALLTTYGRVLARPAGGPSGRPDDSVAAIVLAGGRSLRFGADKAMVEVAPGKTLLRVVIEALEPLFSEVIVVANNAERFGDLPARTAPDLVGDSGALGGIYSGLVACRHDYAFVVGCDMPLLNRSLIAYLLGIPREYDVLLPRHSARFVEPLHAVYSIAIRDIMHRELEDGRCSVTRYLERVRVQHVEEADLRRLDPRLDSFLNVNTSEDLRRAVGVLGGFDPSSDAIATEPTPPTNDSG